MYFIVSGGNVYGRTELLDAMTESGRLGVSAKVDFAEDFPLGQYHESEAERLVGFAAFANTDRKKPVFLLFSKFQGRAAAKANRFGERGEVRKILRIPEADLEFIV